jgi:hypothetical protein
VDTECSTSSVTGLDRPNTEGMIVIKVKSLCLTN